MAIHVRVEQARVLQIFWKLLNTRTNGSLAKSGISPSASLLSLIKANLGQTFCLEKLSYGYLRAGWVSASFANILKTIKYSCEWEFGKVWYKPKCKFVKFDLSKFGTNFLSGKKLSYGCSAQIFANTLKCKFGEFGKVPYKLTANLLILLIF